MSALPTIPVVAAPPVEKSKPYFDERRAVDGIYATRVTQVEFIDETRFVFRRQNTTGIVFRGLMGRF
jgi:hypothetical protein